MQKKKIHWLGNRQFYRTAMALGIPLMFQQLITSSVNLVDNLMVGQLGNTALSSVLMSTAPALIPKGYRGCPAARIALAVLNENAVNGSAHAAITMY